MQSLKAYFPNITMKVDSIDSGVTSTCDIRFCFLEVGFVLVYSG